MQKVYAHETVEKQAIMLKTQRQGRLTSGDPVRQHDVKGQVLTTSYLKLR